MRFSPALILLAALSVGIARPVCADPTAQQQYWLELLNRARSDPAGELARLVNFSSPTTFGSPKSNDPDIAAALAYYGTNAALLASQWSTLTAAPAIAWNDTLAGSADLYSQAMITHDEQSHMLDTSASNEGDALVDRVLTAGFSTQFLDLGENLFASTTSVWHGHAGFLIDWGDDDSNTLNGFGTGIQNPATHREISFDRVFKQVGIGIINSAIPGTNVNATGPLVVTQHFANTYRHTGAFYFSDAILTGVMFNDSVLGDSFYTPGEGIAGATIEVYDNTTSALLFSGTTNSAGGFNIDLPGLLAGREVRVSAPGAGVADQLYTLTGFTANYGPDVTFTDNIHASFIVPEPGALALLAALLMAPRRRRDRD